MDAARVPAAKRQGAAATTIPAEPGNSITFRAIKIRAFRFVLALVVLGGGLLGIWSSALAEPVGRNGTAAVTAAAVTATPTCGPNWQIVPSPNQGTEDNSLGSVAVVSPNDVWAVGYQRNVVWQPLTQHWDGTQWSIVPSPNQGTDYNELRSVAVVSPNDVWAVGYFSGEYPEPTLSTLTEHWDGTSWSIVPSPNEGGNPSSLRSVAAVSSNDVWAVGYFGRGLILQGLVEHWDGTSWSVVPIPQPNHLYADLFSVAAVSSNDVWAVGSYWDNPVIRTLVEHWDGTQWSIVPSPSQGAFSELHSVAALSPTDVWAVGYYYIDTSNAIRRTLTQHWDGTQWSIVPSPNQGSDYNELLSVAVVSPNDVWAVGHYRDGLVYRTLVEHWDGTQWSIVPSPNVGTDSNDLLSVAVVSPNDVWAVGYYRNGSIYQTLIERYNPCPPSPTPTVTGTPPTSTPTSTPTGTSSMTATPPPPTATITPIPPTNTTTPPPTPCVITFSDVFTTDYFYEAVRYLYCAGVISGYSDNTFRPYNPTTRGQLTKIVVLGFGLPLYTPPSPTFTDVPITHTFYQYIETAAHENLVSGYADGTFRPFNNVTRGQLSKIVVQAAAWPIYTPPTPTFSDVPADHPFYTFIETAYRHRIITGYADNTFRSYNDATRGQISKIVYLAVTAP